MKRRLFLTGVGGASLAAPFLPSLAEREAQAASDLATNPRRMVVFYTQNGCLTNRWFPSVENGPIDATALEGTTLGNAGLGQFASKLLFPRGLAMYPKGNITVNGVTYFDPHDQGMGSKLTAAPIDPEGEHWSLGRSLDHVAAELVNQGGAGPLVVSVGNSFANVKGIVSYAAPQEPYSPETNVRNVYTGLTGLFAGGTADAEGSHLVNRGNSIIDLVSEDLTSFKNLNMSGVDQQRVDDWLSLLRETEVQVVSAACNAENAAALGITEAAIDEAGGGGGDNFGGGFVGSETAFTLGSSMMIKLIALTMMCDSNRSIVLQWPGFVTFDWDGITHEYDHHGISHRVGSAAVGGPCVEGVLDMIDQIDNWYASKYFELVSTIDSIAEGDGTMLDNSMVMWLPELADGNAHNNNNLPIVIAGSANGYLKQGAAVNVDGGDLGTGDSEASCQNPGDEVGFGTGSRGGNVPLNKLYATMLNALGATDGGAPFDSFGMADSNDVEAGLTDLGELTDLKA